MQLLLDQVAYHPHYEEYRSQRCGTPLCRSHRLPHLIGACLRQSVGLALCVPRLTEKETEDKRVGVPCSRTVNAGDRTEAQIL